MTGRLVVPEQAFSTKYLDLPLEIAGQRAAEKRLKGFAWRHSL